MVRNKIDLNKYGKKYYKMSSVDNYIKQLNEKEKIVLKIAQEHLGTSFNIEKSIGYKKWLKNLLLESDEPPQNST